MAGEFTPDRHQRDYAYYGAIADGIGGLVIVTLVLRIFPACLINSFQMKRVSCSVYFVDIFAVPAQLSKQKISKINSSQIQLIIRISLASLIIVSYIIILGLLKEPEMILVHCLW